jgi:hypothetical protein
VEGAYLRALWGSAIVASVAALLVKAALQFRATHAVHLLTAGEHPLVLGALALPMYGVVYVVLTRSRGIPEATAVTGRVVRLFRAS